MYAWRSVREGIRQPGVLAALLLFVVLGLYRESLIPWNATGERQHVLLGGDEPTYMLMATALRAGEGLDIGPAHARGDHRRFYDRPIFAEEQYAWHSYFASWLVPVVDRRLAWGDARKAPFPPLLPVLLAPVLGLPNPRWWWGLLQAVALAVTAGVAVSRLRTTGCDRWIPALLLVGGWGTLPIGYYSTQIFPEALAGVCLVVSLLYRSHSLPAARALADAVAFAGLWLTPRLAPAVLLLALWRVGEAIARRKALAPATVFAGWLVYVGGNLYIWGTLFPPMGASFLSNFLLPLLGKGAEAVAKQSCDFFFVRAYGLFAISPLAFCAVLGMSAIAVVRRRPADVLHAGVFWSLALSAALYADGRAGTCPAGRYQVLPAMVAFLGFALALRDESPWLRRVSLLWCMGPLLLNTGISAAVLRHPNYWFRPHHPLFGHGALVPFYGWLPDFRSDDWWIRSLGWAAALVLPLAVLLIGRLFRFRRSVGRHTECTSHLDARDASQ